MTKLQTATHIAVLIASIMLIFYIGKANNKQFTNECDIALDMAQINLRNAYNQPDPENDSLERATMYAEWYDSMCQ